MSNQPDQPQPYVPPGYNAPPVPPYVAPVQPVPEQPQYGQPPAQQNGQPQPQPQPQYGQQPAQQYGQPQFAPPTYYQGGPGYPGPTGPKGLSLASMIIGLASLLLGIGFAIVPQIVGIVLGHMALKRESPQGRGFAITGLITNYLALAIYGFIVGIWLIVVIAAIGSSSTYNY